MQTTPNDLLILAWIAITFIALLFVGINAHWIGYKQGKRVMLAAVKAEREAARAEGVEQGKRLLAQTESEEVCIAPSPHSTFTDGTPIQ